MRTPVLLFMPLVLWTLTAHAQPESGIVCTPVSERAGREFGCFVISHELVGELGKTPVYWHLSKYPTRVAAEAVQEPASAVVESFGSIWLFTIANRGWRPSGGEHIAEIGPLPVVAGVRYSARYMESTFQPGMKSPVHWHPGPEAWYTLTGETCLETPEGKMVGRAGDQQVFVPGGPPMELTATGKEVRRSLALILHNSSQPSGSPAPDWTPKGLCKV